MRPPKKGGATASLRPLARTGVRVRVRVRVRVKALSPDGGTYTLIRDTMSATRSSTAAVGSHHFILTNLAVLLRHGLMSLTKSVS